MCSWEDSRIPPRNGPWWPGNTGIFPGKFSLTHIKVATDKGGKLYSNISGSSLPLLPFLHILGTCDSVPHPAGSSRLHGGSDVSHSFSSRIMVLAGCDTVRRLSMPK